MALYEPDRPMLPAYVEGEWVGYGWVEERQMYSIRRQQGAMSRRPDSLFRLAYLGIVEGHEYSIIRLSHRKVALHKLWEAAKELHSLQRLELNMTEYEEFSSDFVGDPIARPLRLTIGESQYWAVGKTFIFHEDAALDVQLVIHHEIPESRFKEIGSR